MGAAQVLMMDMREEYLGRELMGNAQWCKTSGCLSVKYLPVPVLLLTGPVLLLSSSTTFSVAQRLECIMPTSYSVQEYLHPGPL